MTKMTVTQAIDAIGAINGTSTAEEIYTVLMMLTKAGINEVYTSVTGDAGLAKSWKKEELASTAAGRIARKKDEAAFLAMEVKEKVGYLEVRTELSRRAPIEKCSLYELVVIAKELGISASELKRHQEELCANKIYWSYGLAMALVGVIRRRLYEARESAEKSEEEESAIRLAGERKEKAKTSRLMRKYASETGWILRVYRGAMEYSKDYEIPGYEVTEQDKVEHYLFEDGEEYEASIDYARALALRPRGVRGDDWDIGDYASELIPRIANIVASIGKSLVEEERTESERVEEEESLAVFEEGKTYRHNGEQYKVEKRTRWYATLLDSQGRRQRKAIREYETLRRGKGYERGTEAINLGEWPEIENLYALDEESGVKDENKSEAVLQPAPEVAAREEVQGEETMTEMEKWQAMLDYWDHMAGLANGALRYLPYLSEAEVAETIAQGISWQKEEIEKQYSELEMPPARFEAMLRHFTKSGIEAYMSLRSDVHSTDEMSKEDAVEILFREYQAQWQKKMADSQRTNGECEKAPPAPETLTSEDTPAETPLVEISASKFRELPQREKYAWLTRIPASGAGYYVYLCSESEADAITRMLEVNPEHYRVGSVQKLLTQALEVREVRGRIEDLVKGGATADKVSACLNCILEDVLEPLAREAGMEVMKDTTREEIAEYLTGYYLGTTEHEEEAIPPVEDAPATLVDVCAGVENYECGKLCAEELTEILGQASAETLREYILKVIVPDKERKDAA